MALSSVALMAAGCGDDDDAEAEAAEREYVAAAQDAIRPVVDQSNDLIVEAARAKSVQDLATPLGDAADGYRRTARRLESLDAPDEVDELHAVLVRIHQRIAAAADAASKSARKRETAGFKRFRKAGDRYEKRSDELDRQFRQRGVDF